MRGKLILLLKLAFTALILWFIWDKVDYEQFKRVGSSPFLLSLILGCWFFNQVFVALRLQKILSMLGSPSTFKGVFSAHMVSSFIGNVLPGIIGADIVKFYYLQKGGVSITKTQLALVLLFDRILGLLIIIMMCAVLSVVMLLSDQFILTQDMRILTIAPIVTLLGLVVAFLLLNFGIKHLKRFKLPAIFENLILAYQSFNPKGQGRDFALIWFYNFLAVFILLGGLAIVGGQVHFQETGQAHYFLQFFLIPLVLIASIIPLTPMGIGIAQVTMAGAYAVFGLSENVGVTVSTLSQLGLLLVSVTIGGAIFLMNSKKISLTEMEYETLKEKAQG